MLFLADSRVAAISSHSYESRCKPRFQLYLHQVSFAGERFQIDICDTPHFDII
jgi:hypothetical protein